MPDEDGHGFIARIRSLARRIGDLFGDAAAPLALAWTRERLPLVAPHTPARHYFAEVRAVVGKETPGRMSW
jgi:hypothetical protein